MELGARVRAATDSVPNRLTAWLRSLEVPSGFAELWRRIQEGTLVGQALGLAVLLRVTMVLGKRLTFSGY